MGLFNKKTKEEKVEEKKQKLLKRFGLDELDLHPKDIETLESIATDMAGTGGFLGQVTTIGMKPADMQQCNALWALVRQNWIMIRQLHSLEKKLGNSNEPKEEKNNNKTNSIGKTY